MKRLRAAVLVSGSGTNLQALIDACAQPGFPAEIAVVVSNVATAFALERARKAGIPTVVLEHGAFAGRDAFDAELARTLGERNIELVCLAGFMRILGPTFLRAFPNRVVNIHPALLPSFPGLHGPRQALKAGVRVSGVTVHFVDEGTDTGPIIAQTAVPVLEDDDEKALAARILAQEHEIYPRVVRWIAEGRVSVDGRRVKVGGEAAAEGLALRSPAR